MKERDKLREQYRAVQDEIDALTQKAKEIRQAYMLLSDDEQQFEEKMETFTVREGRKKVQRQALIGRIHWKENFKDESTGEVITINRSQMVRENGEWL